MSHDAIAMSNYSGCRVGSFLPLGLFHSLLLTHRAPFPRGRSRILTLLMFLNLLRLVGIECEEDYEWSMYVECGAMVMIPLAGVVVSRSSRHGEKSSVTMEK